MQGQWFITDEGARAYAPLAMNVLQGDVSADKWEPQQYIATFNEEEQLQQEKDFSDVEKKSIAVVSIYGPLTFHDGLCSPGMKTMASWIREADKNENIKGIVLNIDTPGGSAIGTEYFAKTILSISTPIVAYVEGIACSAGYWIASACDKIILSGESSIVGSIGTMVSFMDYSKYYDSVGLKMIMHRATKSTDKNLPAEEMLEGKPEKYIKTQLDPLNEVFHSAVQNNRPSLDSSTLTGKTYFGQEAIKLGLADEIGTFETAVSAVEEVQISINKDEEMNFLNKVKSALGVEEATPEQVAEVIEQQSQELEQNANDATVRADQAEARVSELEAQISLLNERIQQLEDEPGAKPVVAQVASDSFVESAPKEAEYKSDAIANVAKKQGLVVDYGFVHIPNADANVLI